MGTQNGLRSGKLHRRLATLALVVTALFLTACTQIPADLEQLLAMATVAPTATVVAAEPANEPANDPSLTVFATEGATSVTLTDTVTLAATLAATPAAIDTATDTATVAPTPTETAISAPAFVLPTPTQEVEALVFVLPTPTPRVALVSTESASETMAISATFAISHSATLAATQITSNSLPGFVLPTATPRQVLAATAQITPALTIPMARVRNSINVRSGPGTNYPVIAGLEADARVEIVGRNATSDWLHVAYATGSTGWLSAPLVEVEGDATLIALVTDIPTPPPTATPAPATSTPSVPPVDAPADSATATSAPPAPATGQAEFRVIGKRLWDVYENGGYLDGPSVTCGEKRQLVVTVLDAAGNRLNGVAVQGQYGAREIFITGDGKGDGNVEFVLGGGQDVKVIRDNDGSEAISEMATGLATHPDGIDVEQLIQARYCTDAQSCQSFIDAPGCFGHFSWTVTFQRNR